MNMSNLEKMCGILGIKVNEPFRIMGIKTSWYKINERGHTLWDMGTAQKDWRVDLEILCLLLSEKLKVDKEWSPQIGSAYFYPTFYNPNFVDYDAWQGDIFDICTKRCVGVYKTEREAKEKARELGWI